MMGAVFAMQGIGQFASAMVALVVTAGFRGSLRSAKTVGTCSGVCQKAVDQMWRTVIGFGAVPACIALYFRLTIPETPRYTFDVARDIAKAAEDVEAYKQGRWEGNPDLVQRAAELEKSRQLRIPQASWADFRRHYFQWKNGKVLLGTAGSWFFLDIGEQPVGELIHPFFYSVIGD
jgi:PHS family inorganic phosphate transporter-like MFS transporter